MLLSYRFFKCLIKDLLWNYLILAARLAIKSEKGHIDMCKYTSV